MCPQLHVIVTPLGKFHALFTFAASGQGAAHGPLAPAAKHITSRFSYLK